MKISIDPDTAYPTYLTSATLDITVIEITTGLEVPDLWKI